MPIERSTRLPRFLGLGRPGRPGRAAGLALGLALVVGACAGDPARYDSRNGAQPTGKQVGRAYSVNGRTYVPIEQPGYDRTGVASWYGPGYHGRRTASGQIYDMHAHTAAHPTLPFGTRVLVSNLANGRGVVLTINDRGPFARGRIIDVSRHAAYELDFLRAGTARVRVQIAGGR